MNLSALTTISTGDNGFTSTLQCTNGGTVLDSLLTTMSGLTLALDGTATMASSQMTSLTTGQINVSGGTPNFTGMTNINASGVTVSNGATLALPAVTSYQGPAAELTTVTLEATGAGSILDLSHITSLVGATVFASGANFEALAGGNVKLTAVPGITGQGLFKSDGTNSSLNLSALTTVATGDNGVTSTLQCTNGGTVLDSLLTTMSGLTLALDGTATMATSQMTSLTTGQINVSGGTPNFTGMTNINASGATVSNGATLALPAVTSYQGPAAEQTTVILEATGAGSILDLSHITSLVGATVFASSASFEALSGGNVKLTAVPGITGQGLFKSDGTNSSLNLSALTTIATGDNGFTSTLQCTNGGTVLGSLLTTMSGLTLALDGTAIMSTSQMTSLTSGQINVSGGTPNFAGMSNINASGATVSNGATLALPAVTNYQGPTAELTTVTLEATGAGSILNLSHITTLVGGTVFASGASFEALAGGNVKLTAVPSISGQALFKSDGTNSSLNLSALTTIATGDNGFTSTLQCTNGGTILDSLLTTMSGLTLVLDGTAIMSTSQMTSLTSGQINVSGGTPNFAGMTNINASGATVSNGATLALPAVTSYAGPTVELTTVTLEATGSGSTLDLSHITSLVGGTVFASGVTIEALAGGNLKLTQLVTVSGQVLLKSDGAGSVLDLADLTSVTFGNNGFTSGIQNTNSGQIIRGSATTSRDFDGTGHDELIRRDATTGIWYVTTSAGHEQAWGVWSTGVTWTNIQYADVNGDGKTDVIGRVASSGAWYAAISTGSSFTNVYLGSWTPSVTWNDVQVADINGDGKADIIGRVASSGAWYAGIAAGSGTSMSITSVFLGAWSPGVTWDNVQAADINGDGKTDIVGRVDSSGAWYAGIATGSGTAMSLTTVYLGAWAPSVTWTDVMVADINGDGKIDIVGRVASSGAWYAGIATGSGTSMSLTTVYLGAWSSAVTWTDVHVADINGDGKVDIVGRVASSGAWYAGIATGSGTSMSLGSIYLGSWSPSVTWVNVQVLDLNGDGKFDVIGQISGTNTWWAGISTGTAFTNQQWL